MPTKRAKKEAADAAAGESAAGKRSRSTTAAIKAPDAEHNTLEEAQLSSSYSPARSNSDSSSVVSILPPPAPIDVDAETCEAPVKIKSRRATRQTTLAGEVLSTEAEPSRVATKQSRARGVADGQKGGSAGELKRVAGSARLSRKRAASSMRLEGPAEAPLLEEALLVHMRSALARNFMLITERTIELAAQPHAHCIVGDLDTLPGTAAVGETAEPADDDVTSAKSLMLDARGASSIAMRAVLPCVQYFIVSECARVARVVREEGGNGYGDDPATRAAELLGFLLSMLDKYDTFSDLLVLACPSCRVAGVSYSAFSFLTQYLALSQRASAEEIHLMDQKSLIERLGLLDGCRATTGQPLDVMECCPFGEAHLSLYLLVRTSSGERHSWRLSRLWWQHVPFQLLSFPAIAEAAKAFDACMVRYTADRTRDLIRYQHMVANSSGKWAPPTSKPAKSPKFTAAQRALIKPKAGCLTWAEALLRAILPETAMHPWHRNSEDLQSRIRRCYAYTCADVNHGGYFSVTLEPTLSLLFSTFGTGSFTSTASFVQARLLFAHMKVCQHVAEALLRGGCCSCHSRHDAAAAEVLFVEAHGPFMTALRHCRDESYLLTDNDTVTLGRTAGAAVDADAAEETTTAPGAVSAGGCQEAATFYAAGSFSRFQTTLELAGSMNAAQIVNYVTQVTAEPTETLPAAQMPRQYIRAELKRHQLENVQRMWNKECEGYREHVSVPLYHVDTAAMPAARQVGVMYYCAATNETIVVRGNGGPVVAGREAEAEAWKAWNAAGGRIRGGLLCDDVGLGKTLSILTLCAYDRAMREAGNSDGEEAEALGGEIALAARKVWQVSAKTETMRNCMLWSTREVLHWAFGNFRAGIVPHPTAPTRLPHTTLVVVPLSIATQWIEEIHKFYPTASYILFYGAKRAQYTAADMRRADFVITTYETLSTHLRQEACGLQFWLGHVADEADDAVCAKAASQGWSNLMPSELFAAVQQYASDVVWPAAGGMREAGGTGRRPEMTHICDCAVVPLPQSGQRTCGSHRSGGRDHAPLGSGEKLQVSSPASDTTTSSNTWTLELDAVDGVSVFRCPTLSISVAFDNSVVDATARSVDRHTRLPGTGAVSNAFLDHTWELLRVYSATTTSLPVWQDTVTQCRLFDDQGSPSDTSVFLALLYHAAEEYTLPDSTRRELVRRVLLPPLWRVLAEYWVDMKAHYADVALAETTGRSALRITDLLFRRVVLDESQKCGATSLFHLLSGERRWAVTGTPLNNNKTESLGFALRFLGMHSAARLLSRPPFRHASLTHAYLNTHNVFSASDAAGHSLADSVNRGLRSLWVRRHSDTLPVSVANGVAFCLCAQCMQRDLYNASEASLTNIPSEYRLWTPPRDLQVGLPCLPNSLFEVLTLTMVRHERNEQVSRELQLTPARYQVHSAPLTADEMRLYDRVALVIMNVAARLHRQGILSSRMGYVMQWVQDLCRLCLHPSRVGNDKLLRGDIEAHMLRGVRLTSDNGVCGAGITEVLAASFVAATPQEALEWVKLMAASRKPSLLSDSSVPEETATTLAELAQVPPLLPQCGVCMDSMAVPTLLKCFHMFCKECVLGVIDASREVAGNVSAKCPYCRDRKSMLEEKRVVAVDTAAPVEAAAETRHDDDCCRTATAHSGDEEVDVVLACIGDGSRVRAFLEVVEEIWRTQPDDGVLVFSKYPAFLKLAHDAVAAQGYAPHMVCGASSLAQRQRAMRAMQPPSGASVLSQRRILFVTSRSANAGLNLTFANHVVFLEPNLNPAIEQQAVGRVHRFGQLRQVIVHHFFAPHTIEEVIYRRSVRLREQAAQEPQSPVSATMPGSHTRDSDALQRRTQFGRIAPAEALLLLEYPVPPQTA
ncbi:SNF2 family N-inal domain/DEAD/DEAH box helicase/Ring finger domain/Zinc finger C3HC4 type (RING finger)/Helicase conserved C-inal domain containing protein [Leishmania donovani]|uniref:SNF2 N-terminal domain family protein n=1 Tax=Leishmania donovani TaxID=5661 RepID=A0A6J8FIA8_LEIDO|nr:SNF2 family N-inal domain/DEAD/DEAH box helicase/Ring finger domain/Zinc finger C3HC4 type (RING finger)/Helicase conserved C-inal domain containing protein [Leishmania donovani]VDZ45608.1 SNF2_family_N-inal_domain/DEAD/DEAH_box_helicase/Ring_finger_domain/Zinc_finger_C3HC4_type_(RING_finger)/Helicase_conserved_C-inal_domain_containing_protein_putative/Pfam:PF00176/Pfam:PF00270/Pfam:PF13639/Pfam:PF00097/Pfam:PF00271 [Leishmania donovani]